MEPKIKGALKTTQLSQIVTLLSSNNTLLFISVNDEILGFSNSEKKIDPTMNFMKKLESEMQHINGMYI